MLSPRAPWRGPVSLTTQPMRTTWKAGVFGIALALCTSAAFAEEDPKGYPACDEQPTEGDVAAAKGLFQAGQTSYNEADYEGAIRYWEDAYSRDCSAHPLLWNLSRAYELSGQRKHAVVALKTFLQRVPDTEKRGEIERRIKRLEEQIAKGSDTPPAGLPPAGGTTPPDDGKDPPPVTVDGGTQPTAGGSRPITPLIVAGAGGLITIVGGLLYLDASGEVSDFEDQCPNRQCPSRAVEDDANSARSRKTLMGVVTVGGLAVTGAGLVWYFLSEPEGGNAGQPPRRRAMKPVVAPAVGPGFAGLALSGAF